MPGKMTSFSVESFDVEAFSALTHQPHYLCILAIDNDISNIRYIHKATDDICRYVIDKDIRYLPCIENPSVAVCMYALAKDINNIAQISNPPLEIWQYVVDIDVAYFHYINNPSDEICKYIIDMDVKNFSLIANPSLEVCKHMLNKNPLTLELIREEHRTDEVIKYALDKNYKTFRLLRNKDMYREYLVSIHENSLVLLDNSFSVHDAKLAFSHFPTSLRHIYNARMFLMVLLDLQFNPNTNPCTLLNTIIGMEGYANNRLVFVLGDADNWECKVSYTGNLTYVTELFTINIEWTYMKYNPSPKKCLIVVLNLVNIFS